MSEARERVGLYHGAVRDLALELRAHQAAL